MTSTALFSLTGHTALVTGASSGLGAHFASVLARAGAKVCVSARRLDRLQIVAQRISAEGGIAQAVAMDVTDIPSIARGFDAAESALGPITILINNAGVPSRSRFTDISDAEWRTTMAVNLDGVFAVAREAAKRMARQGSGGTIVNIASILGFITARTLAPYCASKAAVISLTRSMAVELSRDRIRVNALAPGYFSTEINAGFLDSDSGKQMASRIPLRRFGALADLDGPLLLLTSDAGRYMTGSVITVDGGHTIAGI